MWLKDWRTWFLAFFATLISAIVFWRAERRERLKIEASSHRDREALIKAEEGCAKAKAASHTDREALLKAEASSLSNRKTLLKAEEERAKAETASQKDREARLEAEDTIRYELSQIDWNNVIEEDRSMLLSLCAKYCVTPSGSSKAEKETNQWIPTK